MGQVARKTSLSQYIFEGPSGQKDEANYRTLEAMEQLGEISP